MNAVFCFKCTGAGRLCEGLVADRRIAIPGAERRVDLEENLGAVDVELTRADLRDIEDAAAKIAIQGDRLPEGVLKLTNG